MLAARSPASRHSWRVELDGRGLAVGPGDRNRGRREGAKEAGREPCEDAARLGVGDVRHTGDRRLRAGDDGGGAGSDGGRDEILAVDRRALERPEHRSRRDLAVIEREAGHHARGVGGRQGGKKVAEPHFSGTTRPSIPDTSMSWTRSGATPRIGAIRGTILAMLGAVTWPAVE